MNSTIRTPTSWQRNTGPGMTLPVGMRAKSASLQLCQCFLVAVLGSNLCASDPPSFKSQLFNTGTLVYSDEFDGKLDRERWQPRTKTWQVADGTLIGSPDYKNADEAQKVLGRDHHLGLSPVIRLNHLPKKFVLHMRVWACSRPTPTSPAGWRRRSG